MTASSDQLIAALKHQYIDNDPEDDGSLLGALKTQVGYSDWKKLPDQFRQQLAQTRAFKAANERATSKKGKMASISDVAKRAAAALQSKAPNIVDSAKSYLSKATGGAVTDTTPAAVQQYVKNDAPRMAVVASALARAGVSPDEYIDEELRSQSSAIAQVHEMASQVVAKFVQTYSAATSAFPALQDTACVQFAMKSVKVALSIYGSKQNYMLCHPTGGIPAAAFDQYATLYNRVV